MKITVNSKALLEVLSSLKPVATNHILPICDNIWISSSGQTITATNTRDTIIKKLDFKGDMDALVPFKPLFDLVRTLPEQEITIAITEKSISISYDSGKTRLGVADAVKEYPRTPSVADPDLVIDLSSDFIQSVAKRVANFAGVDEHAKPHFNGVYFFFTDNRMYCIGADGRRVAHLSEELPEGFKVGPESNYLVDLQTANLLGIFDVDNSITVSFKDKFVQFESTDTRLIGRLSEYNSHKFEQVLAFNSNHSFKAHRRQLILMIKRVMLIAGTDEIGLNYESGLLHLEAQNRGVGSFIKEKLAVESDVTESVRIGLTTRILIDSLDSIDSEYVWIAFDGERDPFEVMGEGPEYKSMIQPIQYWQQQEL